MLTPEQIDTLYIEHRGDGGPTAICEQFAPALEAEARKDDEALIRQLVEALERADKISGYPNNKAAIKAGRARLEQP